MGNGTECKCWIHAANFSVVLFYIAYISKVERLERLRRLVWPDVEKGTVVDVSRGWGQTHFDVSGAQWSDGEWTRVMVSVLVEDALFVQLYFALGSHLLNDFFKATGLRWLTSRCSVHLLVLHTVSLLLVVFADHVMFIGVGSWVGPDLMWFALKNLYVMRATIAKQITAESSSRGSLVFFALIVMHTAPFALVWFVRVCRAKILQSWPAIRGICCETTLVEYDRGRCHVTKFRVASLVLVVLLFNSVLLGTNLLDNNLAERPRFSAAPDGNQSITAPSAVHHFRNISLMLPMPPQSRPVSKSSSRSFLRLVGTCSFRRFAAALFQQLYGSMGAADASTNRKVDQLMAERQPLVVRWARKPRPGTGADLRERVVDSKRRPPHVFLFVIECGGVTSGASIYKENVLPAPEPIDSSGYRFYALRLVRTRDREAYPVALAEFSLFARKTVSAASLRSWPARKLMLKAREVETVRLRPLWAAAVRDRLVEAPELIDGDTKTIWKDSDFWKHRFSVVVVELEHPTPLVSYSLTTEDRTNCGPGCDPVSWQLLGSSDGKSWTTIDLKVLFDVPSEPSSEHHHFVDFNATETSAAPLVTPFLHRLAGQPNSVVVNAAYPTMPNTNKALVELFCGVTPLIETTWAEFDSPLMRECLPHMLNSLGYSTAFFSPVHIGTAQPRSGFTHLFGKDQVVDFWKRSGFDMPLGELGSLNSVLEDLVVEPLVDFVQRSQADGSPLFVTFMTALSHFDYQVPASANFAAHRFVEAQNPHYNAYLNTVAYVDSVLQKIYDRLLAKGLIDESTLLFITGDHGESFGAHGHFQHGSCVFSECIRVASMMTSPLSSHDTLKSNNRSGFASTEPLGGLRRLVDFFPTALDWIGAETTGGSPLLEGKSLLSSDGHDCIFSYGLFNTEVFAVRCGSIHAVFDPFLGTKADPLETTNLLESQEFVDVSYSTALQSRLIAASDAPPATVSVVLKAMLSRWYVAAVEYRLRNRLLHASESRRGSN